MTGQGKRTPPKDVIRLCEEIVRGYERRKHAYEQRRLDIVYYRGGGFSAGRNPNMSDTVADKTERLEKLEESMDVKFIRAVEQSLAAVGDDVVYESRERLRKAILLNCENGRDYPYEMLDADEFSRRDFYRRRQKFIIGVAAALGLA